MSNKTFLSYTLVLLITLLSLGCDTPTSELEEKLNKEIVIFEGIGQSITDQGIKDLKRSIQLKESQINYRYEKKISGISANLTKSQSKALKKETSEDVEVIPGQFIIFFIDPFDGEKYVTEEGNRWSMETIDKMQERYGITDDKILHRYGYATFGFAAKLSDEQLYNMEEEDLIKHIAQDFSFQIF